ncbi:MAG: hypothetical protein FD147_2525, partial [Chloroflexi bacterium]
MARLVFGAGHNRRSNGLRYLLVGGRGFCLGAGKTRSQKNTRKCGRIPSVRCTQEDGQAIILSERNRRAYLDKSILRIGRHAS